MILSIQGNEVLTKMWDMFRAAYAEHNPGSNLNEAERVFLSHLLGALITHSDCLAHPKHLPNLADLNKRIENIS